MEFQWLESEMVSIDRDEHCEKKKKKNREMGKPTNGNHHRTGQVQPMITHFSHPHPLQIFSIQNLNQARASCSACKAGLPPGATIYGCNSCGFFLHPSCSKLPQQIKHPADPVHVLVLLPVPVYPQGFFNCNACRKQGNGFSYHCRACDIDLHTNCASMPLALTHPSHHHQLGLAFSTPYPNDIFSCDACGTPGQSQWLYRCNPCGFDCHLLCAKTANPRTSNPAHQYCSNPNGVTQVAAPVQSYYPPPTPTPIYEQRAPEVVSPAYVQHNQQTALLRGSNLQGNRNVNYFGGNQFQGLFSNRNNSQNLLANQLFRGMLGGGGGAMSNLGDSSGCGVAGDGGGGGFDFGGNLGDLGSLGGVDLGNHGGMDPGSLGDLGGLGDFSL